MTTMRGNLSVLAAVRHAARLGRKSDLEADALGRMGDLEVHLARTRKQVRQAQAVRYDVFCTEMSAGADPLGHAARLDRDRFDAHCGHLIMVDTVAPPLPRTGRTIGTCRILTADRANSAGGYYSQGEFDLSRLLARNDDLRIMELGRSCILPAYRHQRTVELMWHGIWSCALASRTRAMIGCASFQGVDPTRHAAPLRLLAEIAAAPHEWRVAARSDMESVELTDLAAADLDRKAAMRALPPLVRGYLRLGAVVSGHAVIDRRFGTTDVLIILPVERISRRYLKHFGPAAERHSL